MKSIFYILISVLTLAACKKAEERTCFKSAGKEVTLEVPLQDFGRLFLGPHMKFRLIQGQENKLVITGGENLVNHVATKMDGDQLFITNENKCNFLRSYKKEISVDIYYKNVYVINFEGTKELTTVNQINAPYFTLVIEDGAGACNLDLNTGQLHVVVTNGWGNFNLSGVTDYAKLDIRGDGFGNLYDLEVADSINVLMNTSNNVKIKADQIPLRVQTYGVGDVWYKGTPSSIQFNKYGEGDLVNKN